MTGRWFLGVLLVLAGWAAGGDMEIEVMVTVAAAREGSSHRAERIPIFRERCPIQEIISIV